MHPGISGNYEFGRRFCSATLISAPAMGKKGKGPSAEELLKEECKTWSVPFRDAPPKEKGEAKNTRHGLIRQDIEAAKVAYYASVAAPANTIADWFFHTSERNKWY